MKYYLAHHGKLNQRWGVRHGPPYPLDSNASRQAKRKAASKSSYDKLYGNNVKSKSAPHNINMNLHGLHKNKKLDNPNYILAKKETLLKKIKNKTISGEELVELNDIIDTENKLNKSMNDATRDEASKNFDISKADYEKYMAMEQKAKAIDRTINIASTVFIAAQNLGIAYNKITGSTIGEDIQKRAAIKTSEKKINTVNDHSKEFKKAEEKINQVKDIPLKTITTVPKDAQKISPYGAKLDQSFDMSYYNTRNIKNTSSNIRDRDRLPSYIKNKKVSPYGALVAKHSKIIYKDYLAHHGKLNQRWGVRHGPPYPLDSNASRQAKRKAASKSSYDKLYGNNVKSKSAPHDRNLNSLATTAASAAVAFAPLAVSASTRIASKLINDRRQKIHNYARYIEKKHKIQPIKDEKLSNKPPINELYKKGDPKKLTSEDELKNINVNQRLNKRKNSDEYLSRNFNCINCAIAFELRNRGYDVSAKPLTDNSIKHRTESTDKIAEAFGKTQDDWKGPFQKIAFSKDSNISKKFLYDLEKNPEETVYKIMNSTVKKGERAIIALDGHAINYINTGKGGKFIDTQNLDDKGVSNTNYFPQIISNLFLAGDYESGPYILKTTDVKDSTIAGSTLWVENTNSK